MKWFFKNFEEIISSLALILIILIVAVNVLCRYIFSISFNWAEELAVMGFAWCVFVGASACYKRGMHIGIDIVVRFFPKRLAAAVTIGTNILLVATNIYLTYLSLVFAYTAWEKLTPVMMLPYTFVDISATLGFFMMSIHSIRNLRDEIKGKSKNQDQNEDQIILEI